jgi:DNA-directed RNA polymerase III subunit RPC1
MVEIPKYFRVFCAAGITTVSRAVINEEADIETGAKNYHLLVEGYGLSEVSTPFTPIYIYECTRIPIFNDLDVAGLRVQVMTSPGIDGRYTKSNHIIEMQNVLGIEAARQVITTEIKYIFTAYGQSALCDV